MWSWLVRLWRWKGRGCSVSTATQRLCVSTTWLSVSPMNAAIARRTPTSWLGKERTGTIPTGTICRACLSNFRIASRSIHIWIWRCLCIRYHGRNKSSIALFTLMWLDGPGFAQRAQKSLTRRADTVFERRSSPTPVPGPGLLDLLLEGNDRYQGQRF